MYLLRYERSACRARLVFDGRAKRICARVTAETRGGKMCEKFEFQSGEKSRLPQQSGNRARSSNTSIYTYNIIIILSTYIIYFVFKSKKTRSIKCAHCTLYTAHCSWHHAGTLHNDNMCIFCGRNVKICTIFRYIANNTVILLMSVYQ